MCVYNSACAGDAIRACDSVRDFDTVYVCDMLPHSSGIPFRDLLDCTGWLCYSTLLRFPVLGKQTGYTVPAGPTDAADSSLPLLMVNQLQRAARSFHRQFNDAAGICDQTRAGQMVRILTFCWRFLVTI